MKLVKNIDVAIRRFGDKAAIKMLKDTGYDGIDYSMFVLGKEDSHPICQDNYREFAKELREYADSLELPFLQGHAPFPSYLADDTEYTKKIYPKILRSIEIAGILGIPYLVVHPCQGIIPRDERKNVNMEFYKSLLPYAKKYNVKICLENMWRVDPKRNLLIEDACGYAKEFAEYVDELDSPYFVACLDLGHSSVIGEDADYAIRVLGHDRLKALHVQDNDLRNDAHTLPYYGRMDWDAICKALHDINFDGAFTYEADAFISCLPADLELMTSATRYMHDVGRYLINKINL